MVDQAVDKAKRYDRQLRIWGSHGQARLEGCKVLLLGAGATGSETLKNLVLGGIAAFTIVDDARVCAADLGNNFMLEERHQQQPRAACVTELLYELNEAVSGSYVEEAPESLLERDPGFVAGFGLVVATQMREGPLARLDQVCRQYGVKLLAARSYGLVGCIRASVAEHCIVESNPDSAVDDLRLLAPWPALQAWAQSFHLPSLDDTTFHHLPYVALLLQAIQAWRQQHGGGEPQRVPSTREERSAFKALLAASGRRMVAHGGGEVPLEGGENFEEATKHAFHCWTPYTVPAEVMALLEDEEAVQLRADSPDFWVMVAALRRFVLAQSAQAAAAASSGGGGETMAEDGAGAAAAASASLSGSSASLSEGFLPLEGSIPDMTATTELYLQLQRLYREQAEAHVEAVQNHVRSLLAGLGRAPDSIPGEAVRHVCKHARALRVVRYKALAAEAAGSEGCNSAALQQALACEATQANASFYVLLRASDRFHATHRRLPGLLDSQLEGDVLQLKAAANALLAECGVSGAAISDDYVVEMCRAGGAELHVVAALVGGMAAQEAIKLVTEQFVPVPGVLMYNGITCSTAVLEL